MKHIKNPDFITKEFAQTISGEPEITFLNPISNIEHRAFCKNPYIKKLVFEDSVDNIASEAFYYCDNLESVKFRKDVSFINNNAFAYCKKLSELFYTHINRIGTSAFYSCSVKKLDLDEISSIDDNAFALNRLQEIIIRQPLWVGEYAFQKKPD